MSKKGIEKKADDRDDQEDCDYREEHGEKQGPEEEACSYGEYYKGQRVRYAVGRGFGTAKVVGIAPDGKYLIETEKGIRLYRSSASLTAID